MPYRGREAQLEHLLEVAEQRALLAESHLGRRRRWPYVLLLVVSVLAAALGAYAMAPVEEADPIVLYASDVDQGPSSSWSWPVRRHGEAESYCELIADDSELRHEARLPRRLSLRVQCGDEVLYETSRLRVGEQRLGGCLSQTGRHRDGVVNSWGRQRGVALSVDTEGRVLRLTAADGAVEELTFEGRARVTRSTPTPLIRGMISREESLRARGRIVHLSGTPLVHGLPLPQITGRSTCELTVFSRVDVLLDVRCEMALECDGQRLYVGEGVCHHRGGALQSFADYEATWDSAGRGGRQTPVAAYDAALGRLRILDVDRARGYSMTVELLQPSSPTSPDL